MPIHSAGCHWSLAVIDLSNKEIVIYDSMGGERSSELRLLMWYLRQEAWERNQTEVDLDGFVQVSRVKNLCRQDNSVDCGVFTVMYAEYLSRRSAIDFTQEDMEYFRCKVAYEILINKKIN